MWNFSFKRQDTVHTFHFVQLLKTWTMSAMKPNYAPKNIYTYM